MSTLVNCSVCGYRIANDAEVCNSCGTQGPKAKRRAHRKLIARLFLIAIAVALAGYAWFILVPDIRTHGLVDDRHQVQ